MRALLCIPSELAFPEYEDKRWVVRLRCGKVLTTDILAANAERVVMEWSPNEPFECPQTCGGEGCKVVAL